jgi:hypothetical protein
MAARRGSGERMGVEWAIVAAAALALACVACGWSARGAVVAEAERRHTAECALLDGTILSLRSELEMVRQKGADGAAAAEGQLEVASRVADAPPGRDGDRLLWDPSGGDPAPGGGPAG